MSARLLRLARLAPLLAALACGHAAADETLGRLFYTPEQRRQLDHLRSQGATQAALTQAQTQPLRLDGVLRHPDGRVTTWINGQPADSGRVAAGAGAEQARITTPDGKSISLKVGESLPADGGPPQSLLGDGRVERAPGKAGAR